jgi:hypothetical protein
MFSAVSARVSPFSTLDAADSGSFRSYPNVDRFNRVTSSKWTKDLATDKDYYNVTLTYDRDSNPTLAQDTLYASYDSQYSMDDLNRVVRAQSGTWGGSSFSSTSRDERWMDSSGNNALTQTGNWARYRLDLNGDGDFVDSGELDEARTHNNPNEITARDKDNNASDDYSLTYDKVGNMTDNGED